MITNRMARDAAPEHEFEPELGLPGFEDFKKTIAGISQLGFTWVAPSKVK